MKTVLAALILSSYSITDGDTLRSGETRIRLESVGNAIDQGELAARVIMGERVSYQAKPWFWSDQYDTKLQIVGLSSGYDKTVIRDSGGGVVSFWYFAQNSLVAVDAINDPRGYMVAKRFIEGGRSPDPKVISDPTTDLKSLLR